MHDYKNLTLQELKTMCKSSGLSGYSTMKKGELVRLLSKMDRPSSSARSRSRSSSSTRSSSPSRSASKSPSKRGPGRPKKSRSSRSPSKSPKQCKYGLRQDGKCKRKPGRKSMSSSASKSPSKRGPGRPRKNSPL